jgi:hypothetical protein
MAYGYVKNDQGFEALNGLNTAEMLPPTSTVVPLAVASIATWLDPATTSTTPVATQLPAAGRLVFPLCSVPGITTREPGGPADREQVHAPVPLGTW